MSAPHQTTSSEFIEESIFDIVKDVFGDIPLMRADTPLLALGFQPSHAVLLAHLSKVAGLNVPTDHDFTSMNTIGDFAGVCHSGGTGD